MRHACCLVPVAIGSLLLAGCSGTGDSRPASPASAVGMGACLDPDRARGWEEVDDGLVVDAGRDRFLVRLAPGCLGLATSPTLVFRGGPVDGRICGYPGDEVVLGGERCRVLSVERIDAATYDRLRGVEPKDPGDDG